MTKRAELTAAKLALEYEANDPFSLAMQLGIHVVRHSLVNTGLRGYYMYRKGIPVITVASEYSGFVAKFICAHELGHHLYDKDTNRIFMDYCTYMVPDKFETRADRFAAHLLFGQPPLYQEAITIWEMAEILNVPACNVDSRLLELGICFGA